MGADSRRTRRSARTGPVVIIDRTAMTCRRRPDHEARRGRPDRSRSAPAPGSRRPASYAKVDHLLDIDPGKIQREDAILDRRRFDVVIQAVDRLHDVTR